MSEDRERLIGGYAYGLLEAGEEQRLLRSALDDQALFDELACEEQLRDLLADPESRARVLDELRRSPSRSNVPAPARVLPWHEKIRRIDWRPPATVAATLILAVGLAWQLRDPGPVGPAPPPAGPAPPPPAVGHAPPPPAVSHAPPPPAVDHAPPPPAGPAPPPPVSHAPPPPEHQSRSFEVSPPVAGELRLVLRVTDTGGAPLAGAAVRIEKTADGNVAVRLQARTDDRGLFDSEQAVPGLQPGSYRAMASKDGYQAFDGTIEVKEGRELGTAVLSFRLSPD